MDKWTIDHEKRAIAEEIEEREVGATMHPRVALHRHLENRSPFKEIHIEELAKEAQRLAKIKEEA